MCVDVNKVNDDDDDDEESFTAKLGKRRLTQIEAQNERRKYLKRVRTSNDEHR